MRFCGIPIFCCLLGALALQLLLIIDIYKQEPDKKLYPVSASTCIAFVASMLLAAIVGYIYFGFEDVYNRIVYFHTGASAPFLVRKLTNTLPDALKPKRSVPDTH